MILWALKQYTGWHAARVRHSMLNPKDAQDRVFKRLRGVLQGSVVAQRSGLDRCHTREDCRGLATSDGTTMKPLFQEAWERGAAASRLFGRTRIIGFARTSGTLGEPKDVPMNQAFQDSLDRTLVRMVATHVHTSGTWDTLLPGRRILLGSRPTCGNSPTGLPVGDISGIIPTRTWWSARWAFIPRRRDLWIEDWDTKATRILAQSRGKNVVSISGIPALAHDFAARARATFGVTHLDELWPALRHYIYGAVHLTAEQKAELRNNWRAGTPALQLFETYFATEGALAFSYEPDVDGLALNSLENLYLFRAASGDGPLLFAHELEAGGSYSIHVTTPGGLVNYHLGDRIEVVSTSPLLIRIVGREAEEISMTGEKITVAQVDLALAAAGLARSGVAAALPVVWAEQHGQPHLVWVLPDDGERHTVETHLGTQLDAALCRLNVLYEEALVKEKVIGTSKVIFKSPAAFESQRPSQLGAGQFKARRLFNSRAACCAEYRWDEPPGSTSTDG